VNLNEPNTTEKRTHERRVERATTLVSRYFKLSAKRANMPWSNVNDADVRELVELLIGDLK
jgi:hypothetical protein